MLSSDLWRGRTVLPAAVLLALALLAMGSVSRGWVAGVGAQDATPVAEEEAVLGRPAHIHAGTCDDLDPNPLQPLTDVTEPTGTATGSEEATQVETSFTTVPLDLATMLADDHAINVHLSPEEADVYIACGEIGGIPLDAAGSLAIGLREQNDSGFSGVAYLTPNATDASQTDVSVFLAEDLTEAGLEELEEIVPEPDEETEEATEDEEDAEPTPDD